MIIDFRCPKCNGVLVGQDEVVIRKLPPLKIVRCPHCQTLCERVTDNDDLGDNWCYRPSVFNGVLT